MNLPEPYYHDESSGITIYHADCREILPLLEPGSIDLVLTDPPYGVNVAEWDKVADWSWADHAHRVMRDDTSLLCFWSVPGIPDVPTPADLVYERILVWSKPMTLSSQRANATWHWEPIFWWKKGKPKLSRCVSDVLTYNPPLFRTNPENVNHPTQKPVGLIRELLDLASPEGGIILDPFMGSGTTLRAAKDLGRRAIGIELEERYVEVAIKRLEQSVLPLAEPRSDLQREEHHALPLIEP